VGIVPHQVTLPAVAKSPISQEDDAKLSVIVPTRVRVARHARSFAQGGPAHAAPPSGIRGKGSPISGGTLTILPLKKIISGGQIGVDRGALDAALVSRV